MLHHRYHLVLPDRKTPHEFSTQEVYEMIQDYIDAAMRAKKAGFDAVENSMRAHGYYGWTVLKPAFPQED